MARFLFSFFMLFRLSLAFFRPEFPFKNLFKNLEPLSFAMHQSKKDLARLTRRNVGSYMRVFIVVASISL